MSNVDSQSRKTVVEILKLAGADKRIVFVSGNFNTLHPGHLRLLRFATECGDFLVIGVTNNDAEGALVPEELRLDGIKSISFVDYAFILSTAPEVFIQQLKPQVVVRGKEHEGRFNVEQSVVESYGGELLYGSGEMRFSSVHLLKQEMLESDLSSIIRPMDFTERHSFTMADLRATVDKFKGFRVTVIGDLIVDEYIDCDPLGMSQEDPTIVVTPIQSASFVGGAAIVAAHARSIGADVQFISVSGKDASADFAQDKLIEYGVSAEVFQDDNRPTTLKQRYRAAGKTLLRVSHLRQQAVSQEIANRILNKVKAVLPTTDILIFSDFNYGCLPQALVDNIVDLCKSQRVLMVGDSQSSSQVGDVSRFKDMMLLTPTEREARLSLSDFNSGLVVIAEKLRKKSRAKNILITLGAEGLLSHAAAKNNNEWSTDRLPAFNVAPKDSAGAGDSLLACCSLSLAVGADIWQSMYLGSIAAACQISRVGNIPLSPQDIASELAD
ncbi:PfkB family carbohydrate kinase [Porticoccaceae bacterium]|nr:PfkB family carbohydrate kinase [Porticoccaceae bacterium]